MRRGFKTQAETISIRYRRQLGLSVRDPLGPKAFLESLGIIVWEPADIPGLSPQSLKQLTVVDPDSWSGVTIRESEQALIVINPTHPATRQANTLMHEWAHLELRHKPNRVDRSNGGLLLLSDYPKEQEDEANWLAATMLLPRDGLLYHCGRGLLGADIAEHYGVSEQLANWRIGKTGVSRQLRHRRFA